MSILGFKLFSLLKKGSTEVVSVGIPLFDIYEYIAKFVPIAIFYIGDFLQMTM